MTPLLKDNPTSQSLQFTEKQFIFQAILSQ